MFYLLTEMVLIVAFLMLKKSDSKQNILVWIPVAFVLYECLRCVDLGILCMVKIPVSIVPAAILNIIYAAIIIWRIVKTKQKQAYYFHIEDLIFTIVFIGIMFAVVYSHYTKGLRIRFETSDPSVHLNYALRFINTKGLESMYLGETTNGLFIEALSRWCSGAKIYIPFILRGIINLVLAGGIFAGMVIRYADNFLKKIVVYMVSILYLFAYPLNDMLFGFTYLQMAVTIIGVIVIIMDMYLKDEIKNSYMALAFVAMCCLGVGVGYTLFAPLVYFAVLLCIAYKAFKEQWLWEKVFFAKKFVISGLVTFLIPTILVLYYIVIAPRLASPEVLGVSNALIQEGYIYRNLYSDFVIYLIPAILAFVVSIRNKKCNMYTFLFPMMIVYDLIFFYLMYNMKVSTYYYYKLNFLNWLLVTYGFVLGMNEIIDKMRSLAYTIIVCFLLVIVAFGSRFEDKLYLANPLNTSYYEAASFFHIYEFNWTIMDKKTEVSKNLVKVSKEIIKNGYEENGVGFIGDYVSSFWFMSLTNQYIDSTYAFVTPDQKLAGVGVSYDYIVIMKKSEEYEAVKDLIDQSKIVYENKGYLLVSK